MNRQPLCLRAFSCMFIVLGLALSGLFTIKSYASGVFGLALFVDSIGDESDADLSDDICNTSKNECTLRAAIEQANETANVNADTLDEISFDIDGLDVHTIQPMSPLPVITEAVYIDGYTQGIAKLNTLVVGSDAVLLIEIDGSLAGALTHGLTLESNGSTIRGLVINRFGLANILLDGANENHIEGNYIGTDATGTFARPNGADGIALFDSASNVFGGATPDKRNVISGNAWSGIAILNGPSQGNIVEGNYIGTDPSGLNDVGNELDGVLITALVGVNVYASNNRIGGAGAGQHNIISGNGRAGVQVFRGTRNEILGNLIGTKVDGSTRLPNQNDGVLLNEASNNLVGGQFVGDGSGTIAAYKRNILSGNAGRGISIFVGNQSASGNLVVGNYIGTDITGLQSVPNTFGGVLLGSGVGAAGTVANNIIGGTDGTSATRNIISGNDSSGVSLVGPMVTTNEVVGNFIGLDKTGTVKLGNALDGVRFTTFGGQATGPTSNFIGTSTSTGGNVISGNGRDGVAIAFGSSGNFVVNNLIGLDDGGTGIDPDGIPDSGDELGNTRHGVAIFDSPNNSIGDGVIAHRNVISGNKGSGVSIEGLNNPGAATGNTVAGNFIGVDYDGLEIIGNVGDGVLIEDAPGNTIGGEQPGTGNVISGNERDGVHISGNLSTGTQVTRNTIGLSSDRTIATGNVRHGVFIADGFDNAIGAAENVVGGIDFLGNAIAHNGGSGVVIESGTRCTIRGNQIFENDGLGIDLGGDGFTENDPADMDSGANELQNFPIVTTEIVGSRTDVTIDVNANPEINYLIDVYGDEVSHDVFTVQGRSFLDSNNVTTDDTGMARVLFSILGVHHNISVTLTDPDGNTSEFGREQLVHGVEFTQAIQTFQPLDKFQSTLDATDEPPVPMIAGKPGVMRVYLRELSDNTNIKFEVEGLDSVLQQEIIQAKLGCTPLDRRRKDPAALRKCLSSDFYFCNPPQGQWTTVLTVRTPSGAVFERHRFRQVTRTAKTLVLNAASICHGVDASGNWICGDETRLNSLTGLLRSIAPTHKVMVELSHHFAAARLSLLDLDSDGKDVSQVGNLYEKRKWINTMKFNLALVSRAPQFVSPAATDELHLFYGMMRFLPNFPGGSALIDGDSAIGMQSGPASAARTVAHETSHMLGRQHTNRRGGMNTNPICSTLASDSDTDWPFCDSTIQSNPVACTSATGPVATKEIGFDVSKKLPIAHGSAFDIMSYCSPKWISPFTYNQLAKSRLVPLPGSSFERQGFGTSSITGSFWLVAGELDNGVATFSPLLEFDTTDLDTPGAGSHRIEVRDAGDIILSTRFFEPLIASTEIDEGEVDVLNLPFFAELIPVQVGARRIVVLDSFDTELGSIMLNGTPPTVTVDFTPGGAPLSGPLTVGWTIVDPDSTEHTVWVQYSNDNGLTWNTLSLSETEIELRIDFDMLPGADGSAIIRVLATDGVNSGFGDSTPFSVAHKLPQVEIFFPEDGTVFRRGELVWLQASVSDLDESSIDEAAITWTSSVDGALGQGEELPTTSLSVGVHTITVTGTDTDGNMAEHSIDVIVEDSPLVETTAVINVPADVQTIQGAIDVSSSGDGIIVAPGTYDEIIDFSGKGITLRSSGGAEVTIIDATIAPDPGTGKPVVRCDNGESASSVLDGFTITGGTGDTSMSGVAFTRGGGIFNNGSNPTVTNCTFSGNAVNFSGGGMFNNGSSPTVTDCTFDGNLAETGGGMNNSATSDPIVANCKFSGNTAEQFGGGIFNNNSSPKVTNCKFNGNEAEFGGGMYSFLGSPTVTTCIFSGNAALSNGGGMMNRLCSPNVTGSTFSGNTALSDGGGMHNLDSCEPAVTNCIFWMNLDLGGTDESGQINNDDTLGPNLPTVSFSDVQGGWTGVGGVGNINIDPQFMDADGSDNIVGTEDDDLRLRVGSPCIDSGDPAYVASSGEIDLDGHDRVLCDRIEMGAYEFSGDFACDQTIDLNDFAYWNACMTGPGNGPYAAECATFDCDADLDIDLQDFAEFGNVFSP